MTSKEIVSEAKILGVPVYNENGRKYPNAKLKKDILAAREEKCKSFGQQCLPIYIATYIYTVNGTTSQATGFLRKDCTLEQAPNIVKRRMEGCYFDVKVIDCIPTTTEYLVNSIRSGKYTFLDRI